MKNCAGENVYSKLADWGIAVQGRRHGSFPFLGHGKGELVQSIGSEDEVFGRLELPQILDLLVGVVIQVDENGRGSECSILEGELCVLLHRVCRQHRMSVASAGKLVMWTYLEIEARWRLVSERKFKQTFKHSFTEPSLALCRKVCDSCSE